MVFGVLVFWSFLFCYVNSLGGCFVLDAKLGGSEMLAYY
jgi:hypothetical protein